METVFLCPSDVETCGGGRYQYQMLVGIFALDAGALARPFCVDTCRVSYVQDASSKCDPNRLVRWPEQCARCACSLNEGPAVW